MLYLEISDEDHKDAGESEARLKEGAFMTSWGKQDGVESKWMCMLLKSGDCWESRIFRRMVEEDYKTSIHD